MKVLWGNRWLDAPDPHPVRGSTLIEVAATAPIKPLGPAHGRRFESPAVKVVSFAITDGPAATLRKARSKRAESSYSGDYGFVVALGRLVEGAEQGGVTPRVVALMTRAPRFAERMLAPAELVQSVGPGFDAAALGGLAARLKRDLADLSSQLGQSYLYSGMPPPEALVVALERGLRDSEGDGALGVIEHPGSPSRVSEVLAIPTARSRPNAPPLAILGAGDYVRIEVAPSLEGAALERAILADREPQIAALAARELNFKAATTDAEGAIDALGRRGLVVVATAHDSHAALAARALAAGHRVICEKPGVVDIADLDLIKDAAAAAPGELEMGFNRRHSPMVDQARRRIGKERGPCTIVATIREVDIQPGHWYFWPNQGTRVAGNLCHWIDLALHLMDPRAEPLSVSISPRVDQGVRGVDAERVFSVSFDDGSLVALVPTGRGDSVRGVQEQIEIHRGSLTLRIDDLWRVRGTRSGRPIALRGVWRSKGHREMYRQFLDRFVHDEGAEYPLEDLRKGGEIQLAATELLLRGGSSGTVVELLEQARLRSGSASADRPVS